MFTFAAAYVVRLVRTSARPRCAADTGTSDFRTPCMSTSANLRSALSPRSMPKRAVAHKSGSSTRTPAGPPPGWSSCTSQMPPPSLSGLPEYRVRSPLKAAGSVSDAASTTDHFPLDRRCRRDGWHTLVPFHETIESRSSRAADRGGIIPKHGATAADAQASRIRKWEHAPHHRGDRGGQIRLSAARESERQRCSAVSRLDLFAVHIAPTVGTTGRVVSGP